jgi:SAM-dependent methyltransferase
MIEGRRMDITGRAAVPLLLAPLCVWGQNNASDQEWSLFLTWVKAMPPGSFGNQREIFPAYKKKVTADGMADPEALVARPQKRSIDNPEWMALNFNRLYSQGSGNRRTTPNAFLAETVSTLRPGKALDVGMGEGRYDLPRTAGLGRHWPGPCVAQANERARSLGVRINARVQDVDLFDFGTGQWDLVCLLYFVIGERQQNIYQRITSALKPGGHVIVEGLGLPALETLLQAWSNLTVVSPIRVRSSTSESPRAHSYRFSGTQARSLHRPDNSSSDSRTLAYPG